MGQDSSQQVAKAYQDAADRAERMHGESVRAMSGQAGNMVQAERDAADRVERLSDRAMDRMSEVAVTRAQPSAAGQAVVSGKVAKVRVCGKCHQEIGADKNFCPNCGENVF